MPYVGAFINGLAESGALAEWLFDVVRRFAPRHNIKRIVAWALEKRVGTGLPDDLTDLLESYVRDTSVELEESDRDPYSRYLNSDRGSAFMTLMRALDQRAAEEDTRRKWELMDEDDERCQQTGAELACIAMISPQAMSSVEEQIHAQELATQTLSGPPAWRRGAAQVYA